MGLKLDFYNIIKGPVLSNKAYLINKHKDRIMLLVDPNANKPMIKQAVETIFNVKVKRVNTESRKGKARLSRRKVFTGKTKKIAFITLQPGYSLDLFNQTSAITPAENKE
jgi:large subunit ribosomal protein L23